MVDQFGRWYPDFAGQQPYQDPAYMRTMGQQPAQMPGASQQARPSKMVDVVPVDSEEEAESAPVGKGCTQLMLARDDTFIAVKAVSVSGQISFDIYDKRPPAPPKPTINPADYVRKDEIDGYIAAALAAKVTPKRTSRKTEEDEE